MRIRPAKHGDAATVTGLWTEAYTGRGPGGRRDPYEEDDFFASAERGRVSVAEAEGAAAGHDSGDAGVLGAVVFYPPGTEWRAVALEGEAELSRLAVAEAARGRGIGSALARHCAEQARGAGATAVALWSRPYQRDAHRLYERLGYRRVPQRDGDDADGRRLVFLLDLPAAG
jgi:ribosomal protein S18 acetylase RimI-like enzyme